jgi:hypothetical protein
MEPITQVLGVVARVMQEDAATHSDNNGVGPNPEYHLGARRTFAPLARPRSASGPLIPCNDAFVDCFNLTRAGLIWPSSWRTKRIETEH